MSFKLKHLLVCGMAAGILGGGLLAASASGHGSLKLLRLNLHDQLVESVSVDGDTGCHNFLWSRSAYRVTQRGYAYCELYTKRSCPADSIAEVQWLGSHYRPQKLDTNALQTRIRPGTRWQLKTPDDKRENLRIASWRCAYQDE